MGNEPAFGVKIHCSGRRFYPRGEASGGVKKDVKQLGFPAEVIRKVAIALYEGEINMVIHAGGGWITVEILPEKIDMILEDHGPGIADISLAMRAGYSTAPDQVRDLGFGAGMGFPIWKNTAMILKSKAP